MIDDTDQDYTPSVIVPVQPVPSQILNVALAPVGSPQQQRTTLQIYDKGSSYGMFMDVFLNNALVIGGVQCLDRNRIIRSTYLGYQGDFAFFDTEPTFQGGVAIFSDPFFAGLGSRFLLGYLT
jgi:hypothetical protein